MAGLEELLGKWFANVHDGRRGRLVQGNQAAVFGLDYKDRGEVRFEPVTLAKLREDWRQEDDLPRKLRLEEMLKVAGIADLKLRSFERNQPFRWWESGEFVEGAHDPELVAVIVDYLRKRQ